MSAVTFTEAKNTVMIAVAEVLNPSQSRLPINRRPAEMVLVHLSQPRRRALIRAVGFGEVPEAYLKAAYGASWGDVQHDLRTLLRAGILVCREINGRAHYHLDLSAFPQQMAASMFSRELRAAA